MRDTTEMASLGLVCVSVGPNSETVGVIWGMRASPRTDTQDGPPAVTVTGSRNTHASQSETAFGFKRREWRKLESGMPLRAAKSCNKTIAWLKHFSLHLCLLIQTEQKERKMKAVLNLHVFQAQSNACVSFMSCFLLPASSAVLFFYSSLVAIVKFRGWRYGVKSSPRSDKREIVIKLGRPCSQVAGD